MGENWPFDIKDSEFLLKIISSIEHLIINTISKKNKLTYIVFHDGSNSTYLSRARSHPNLGFSFQRYYGLNSSILFFSFRRVHSFDLPRVNLLN